MSIYNVLKENNHKTNYAKKSCLPSNNPSMKRGSFGSVHCSGNLSIEKKFIRIKLYIEHYITRVSETWHIWRNYM